MEFTVIYDPLEHAILTGLPMDERHQRLPDGEFVRWLNRITGRKDLFMYYHRETDKFVLAQWLAHEPPVCNELDIWDQPPDWIADQIDREHYWRTRLCSVQEGVERMKRSIRDRRSEEHAAKVDSAEQRKGAVKYLKQKGMEREAAHLASGVPYVGKREAEMRGTQPIMEGLKG